LFPYSIFDQLNLPIYLSIYQKAVDLTPVQTGIATPSAEQCIMISAFDDSALFEHDNTIRRQHCRKAVGNHKRRAPPGK
jgi:hypothetical protein